MSTSVLEAHSTSASTGLRPAAMKRILVIEEDRALQMVLRRLFCSEGYEVEVITDNLTSLELQRMETASTLIFDIGKAGLLKYDLCRQVTRTIPHVPCVILSANSDVSEKVLFLELGADDYVTIPFSPIELVARVRAIIRRTVHSDPPMFYAFESVMVDFLSMEVTRYGEMVELTIKEFKTLEYLIKNANRVISRDELLNEVWGYRSYPCTRTVDNHILKLRQKLEEKPSNPSHFLTTHGAGYKFVA
jgi:DNA-binding response OmpR family regulator